MSKAEKRACQYTGYCKNQSYSDFLNGYHQAEKDLELTWEDMFNVFHLVNEVLDDDYVEGKSKKEVGEEVLKRFKNMKDGSKGNDVKD